MNSLRSVGVTLLALSMSVGGLASAKDDRGPPDRNDRHAERRGPPDRHDRGHWDKRDKRDKHLKHEKREKHDNRSFKADDDGPRYNERGEWRDQRGNWRGAGPNHDFRRGGRLPAQYRSRQYVVTDWHSHQLTQPPRGYHWVQTGSDYVLAAIATGVILHIFLNN